MSLLKTGNSTFSVLTVENGVRLPVLPSVPLGDPSRQSTMATIVVTSEETRVPNVPLVAEPEQMEEPSQLEPISIDDEIAQLDALEDYLEKATTRRTSTAISAPPNTEHLIGTSSKFPLTKICPTKNRQMCRHCELSPLQQRQQYPSPRLSCPQDTVTQPPAPPKVAIQQSVPTVKAHHSVMRPSLINKVPSISSQDPTTFVVQKRYQSQQLSHPLGLLPQPSCPMNSGFSIPCPQH